MGPYKQGHLDFKRGQISNPYKEFAKVREWDRGFNDSYFANLKWVEKKEARQKDES